MSVGQCSSRLNSVPLRRTANQGVPDEVDRMMTRARDLFPGDKITLRITVDSVQRYDNSFVSVGNAADNINLNVEPSTRLSVRRSLRARLFHILNGHR